MIKSIPHFQANRYLQEATTLQTSIIFKQYNDINYLLKKELEGLKKSHFEYVAESEIEKHKAYGKTNASDILFEEFGVKIKKQDGSDFSDDETTAAKVMELVLSLGSSAKPLAPKSFVNKWKKEVAAMFENSNS